jgi:ubiquinone/menaquinone biosynthesis C-methylase UbiE
VSGGVGPAGLTLQLAPVIPEAEAIAEAIGDLAHLFSENQPMTRFTSGGGAAADVHQAVIVDQFSRQAEQFATRPALHNKQALDLLVDAADPRAGDVTLDVACGPGSVVVAFAQRVARAEGLDATEAMLVEARKLAAVSGIDNVAWHRGDVYALPFADGAFDIVSCRFAFHHLQEPARAFGEMIRVCRLGGRIVLSDAVASDDPRKAAAFNSMERHRDPSTVEFRPLPYLQGLFRDAGLSEPAAHFFQVPAERERLIAMAYPANGDRALLRGHDRWVGRRRHHRRQRSPRRRHRTVRLSGGRAGGRQRPGVNGAHPSSPKPRAIGDTICSSLVLAL